MQKNYFFNIISVLFNSYGLPFQFYTIKKDIYFFIFIRLFLSLFLRLSFRREIHLTVYRNQELIF